MTEFFSRIFTRHPIFTHRILEMLPGFITWTLILSPIWGSLLMPQAIAYAILFFDMYWFYKSFSLTFTAYLASRKIKQAEAQNWLHKARRLPHLQKVHHVIVIPNYQEKIEKLKLTIQALAAQTFPRKQIYIILAMEQREEEAEKKANLLINEFHGVFAGIFATYHPDVVGEVKGKSSNEAYAGRVAYQKLFIEKGLDINFATVSSVDADSIFDRQYFAYLAYSFLQDEKRYNKFWQSATVFYNNIWKVPAPTRIITFFGSLWRTSLLVQGDRLITQSTYSLSFKLLKEIDFWDVDVIPEDYRVFFKAFFRTRGNVWVEPIFLRTSMDAAQSTTYIRSLKNKYHQERRWSWGVSDDPIFIKWWFTVAGVPFIRKTVLLYHVLLDHFLWPVNWFVITIAANVMPFINPSFSRTALGYSLPKLAALILTFCLGAIVIMLIIDYKNRPKHLAPSLKRQLFFPFEFILMPLVGFFLSALPALISHTKLMFGKRLEYRVTEKV